MAIDPVAPARAVLDPVIVAQADGRFLAPPFGRDPLRPLDPRDFVHLPPPAELLREAVGRGVEHGDRFRPVEQLERAGVESQLLLKTMGTGRLGLQRWLPALGALRDVAGEGHRAAHRMRAEPHGQPVDAGRKAGAMVFRRRLQVPLAEVERFGPRGAHPHALDPEAGVDIVELGGEQAADMRGIAGGGGHFQAADDHLSIHAPDADLQPARALSLRLQLARHVGGKVAHHLVEQVAVADRFDQAALHQRHLRRDHRQQRLGHLAEQLVEPHQRVRGRRAAVAEPAVERIAALALGKAVGQVADPLQAEPAQDDQHILVEPQGRHGQAGKPRHRIVIGGKDRAVRTVVGKRPGRACRGRDGEPRRQPALREQRRRIGQQPLLAREQVRRAGDIHQQRIGRVHRRPRAPALRPRGKPFEEVEIACRV